MVIWDHIFPFFGDIAIIVCLENKMANFTMHVLSNNRNYFIAIIDHEKMPRERNHGVKD
jgi:hypothetical protein